MYNATVMRYFRADKYVGTLEAGGGTPVVKLVAGSAKQGEIIEFYLVIVAGMLQQVRFKCYGCPYIIAMCSYIAEQLELAANISTFTSITARELSSIFNLPKQKYHAALLAYELQQQIQSL